MKTYIKALFKKVSSIFTLSPGLDLACYLSNTIIVGVMHLLIRNLTNLEVLDTEDKNHSNPNYHNFSLSSLKHILRNMMCTNNCYTTFIMTSLVLHIIVGLFTFTVKSIITRGRQNENLTPSITLQVKERQPLIYFLKDCLNNLKLLSRSLVHFGTFIVLAIVQYSVFYYLIVGLSGSLHPNLMNFCPLSCRELYPSLQNNHEGVKANEIENYTEVKVIGSRMLSDQDPFDAINITGSLDFLQGEIIIGAYFAASTIIQTNDTHLILFTAETINNIDVSDYTSPKITSSLEIPVDLTTVVFRALLASPDAQIVLRTYASSNNNYLCITSTSENSTTCKESLSVSNWIFSPGSREVYIISDGFYKLDLSSKEKEFKLINQAINSENEACMVYSRTQDFIVIAQSSMIYIYTKDNDHIATSSIKDLDSFYSSAVALSSDDKILFYLGSREVNYEENCLIIVDISDPSNPTVVSSLPISSYQVELKLSPDDHTLVLQSSNPSLSNQAYIIDVSDITKPTVIQSEILSTTLCLAFSTNNQYVFISTPTKFMVGSLFVNVPIGQKLPYNPVTFNAQEINGPQYYQAITGSYGSSTVLIASKEGVKIFELVNNTNLIEKTTVLNITSVESMVLSSDQLRLVTCDQNSTFITRTSDQKVLSVVPWSGINRLPASNQLSERYNIAISPNGNFLLGIYTGSDGSLEKANLRTSIQGVDVSDLTKQNEPKNLWQFDDIIDTAFTSNWEVFVTATFSGHTISFYNFTDPLSPKLLTEVVTPNIGDEITSIALSYDDQTLFVKVANIMTSLIILLIYDISDDFRDISLAGTFNIGAYYYSNGIGRQLFCHPTNPDLIVASYMSELLVIDISQKSYPKTISFIHVFDKPSDYNSVQLLQWLSNSSMPSIFIAYSSFPTGGFKLATSVAPDYMLGLQNLTIGCGAPYSGNPIILKKNSIDAYSIITDNYRIFSFSLHEVDVRTTPPTSLYKTPPSWITFDMMNGFLNIEPRDYRDIGLYYTQYTLTTQIKLDEFNNITDGNSKPLVKDLISLGYMDSDYYVTSSFDPNKTLFLPSNESKEQDIRWILSNHSFGVVGRINIESSLYRNKTEPNISISSASPFPLHVYISIFDIADNSIHKCQFVSRLNSMLTPTFLDENTQIIFDGLQFQVNELLENIIINIPDGQASCDGVLTVMDSINPIYNETIYGISSFMKQNPIPEIASDSLLKEILSKATIYTNTYFVVVLDPAIFSQDNLRFELSSEEIRVWLTITGLTLTGTAPARLWYQFWPVTYKVPVRVWNEYKFMDMNIDLEVNVSLADYVKLLIKLFSLISLYVYFNAILNILFQKAYLDSKPWIVRTGQQITSTTIFPIAFIKNETTESKLILRQLLKTVANKLQRRTISKEELVKCFIDSDLRQLNVNKLVAEINIIRNNLSSTKKHTDETPSARDLIHQLILNDMVITQLCMTEEQLTMRAYNKLKNEWRTLVRKDDLYLWQFSIDHDKLQDRLSEIMNIGNDSTSQKAVLKNESTNSIELCATSSLCNEKSSVSNIDSHREDSIKTELMKNLKQNESTNSNNLSDARQLNIDLLGRAIVAYAFEKQHVNTNCVYINVTSKQKMNRYRCIPKIIQRFFKLDIQPLLFNKGNIVGYGIKYKVTDSVLQFYGVAYEDMEDVTLFVEIMNPKGRIFKSILIYGVKQDGCLLGLSNKDEEVL